MSAFVIAEFAAKEPALEAAARLREIGFGPIDLHSPYPLQGAEAALALGRSRIPQIALAGGLAGAAAGYLLQYWVQAVAWPMNIGGRPPHAAPAFIPIAFELAILASSLAIFVGLMVIFRFPQPYHPVFEDLAFRSASSDAFWVSVEMHDPAIETELLQKRFESFGARRISRVEPPA